MISSRLLFGEGVIRRYTLIASLCYSPRTRPACHASAWTVPSRDTKDIHLGNQTNVIFHLIKREKTDHTPASPSRVITAWRNNSHPVGSKLTKVTYPIDHTYVDDFHRKMSDPYRRRGSARVNVYTAETQVSVNTRSRWRVVVSPPEYSLSHQFDCVKQLNDSPLLEFILINKKKNENTHIFSTETMGGCFVLGARYAFLRNGQWLSHQLQLENKERDTNVGKPLNIQFPSPLFHSLT